MRINPMPQTILGSAIEVHRVLGPGLLENAYETALCQELQLQRVPYQRQKGLVMNSKGVTLPVSSRLDLWVFGQVVVEVKAVETRLPIHEAQLLTDLKLGGYQVGLLLNCNVPQLRDGMVRRVFGLHNSIRLGVLGVSAVNRTKMVGFPTLSRPENCLEIGEYYKCLSCFQIAKTKVA